MQTEVGTRISVANKYSAKQRRKYLSKPIGIGVAHQFLWVKSRPIAWFGHGVGNTE